MADRIEAQDLYKVMNKKQNTNINQRTRVIQKHINIGDIAKSRTKTGL